MSASTSLSYQVTPNFFIGAEARLTSYFNSLSLPSLNGYAVYAGPTLFYKLNDKISFSAAWEPQVFGHNIGTPGPLNLTDYERQQIKLKISIGF